MTAPTVEVLNWRQRAQCRSVDPEIMFPDPSDADGLAKARTVCLPCPVKASCLAWADDHDIRHGVWAGLTSAERGRPRKKPGVVNAQRTCNRCSAPFRSGRASQTLCHGCSAVVRPAPLKASEAVLARADEIAGWKRQKLSDGKIARLIGCSQSTVTLARHNLGIDVHGNVKAPAGVA